MPSPSIQLTASQVLPPDGKGILVGTHPNQVYDDKGNRTDRTEGIKADVRALPDLSAVTVKLSNVAVPPMSNDELERLNGQGRFVWVEFKDFIGKQYYSYRNKSMSVSATATGITVVDSPVTGDELDFAT